MGHHATVVRNSGMQGAGKAIVSCELLVASSLEEGSVGEGAGIFGGRRRR
jgi:hypothetical protein